MGRRKVGFVTQSDFLATNHVEHCIDLRRGRRFIFSNGVPPHDVPLTPGRFSPCVHRYAVELPLWPRVQPAKGTETPTNGPAAFTLSGLPMVGQARAVLRGIMDGPNTWAGESISRSIAPFW